MEKLINVIGILIMLTLACMWIRNLFIILKRPSRKRELRAAIDHILEPQGCSFARSKFAECDHIVEHYGINLTDVGYAGDLVALEIDAEKSYDRSLQRDREAVVAFGFSAQIVRGNTRQCSSTGRQFENSNN